MNRMSRPITDEFMVRGDIYSAEVSVENLTGMEAWEAAVNIYSLMEKKSDGSLVEVHPEDREWIEDNIREQCRMENFRFKDREYSEESKEYHAEMIGDETRGN
jgi:hypothetical protein